MKPILILGGGLAGVSAAHHLRQKPLLLIEREKELGGTARSFKVGGFTFDFTGHLLHLHTPYTKKLIEHLLAGNYFECSRNAAIHSFGATTDYPFQANTKGLPDSVIDDCVLHFFQALQNRPHLKKSFANMNFKEWCMAVFGEGISKYFMWPYNEKLYQVPAQSMTVDWCGSFVPTPKLEDVIKGALLTQENKFGYNTKFLYPKSGGIQVLAQKLGEGIRDIRFETTVTRIDWKDKKAYVSDQTAISYENMINTIPLAELLRLMAPLPLEVENARQQLRCVGVLCVNLGVNRKKISDRSWIYFPERKYPFYRVGFPMNFTPHVVPAGCSSMYVEIPFTYSKGKSEKAILAETRKGLIDAGILRTTDRFVVTQFLPIRYAYVVYDQHRNAALKTIFSFLEKQQVQSIGRYGAWKYSFMEEAILDGKKAAENLLHNS